MFERSKRSRARMAQCVLRAKLGKIRHLPQRKIMSQAVNQAGGKMIARTVRIND